jgi:cellulose synthase/poly-beta-1,6-N-acetylglucosamine synthase-like glycosyltransferase
VTSRAPVADRTEVPCPAFASTQRTVSVPSYSNDSFQLIWQSDIFLLLFSVVVFDIPRYLLATTAVALAGFGPTRVCTTCRPRVSVVVSLFNGADTLPRCLEALQHQTLEPFEIIVIDDGSTDRTRTVALQAFERGLISKFIHHETRCGKAASINHGARFASGDLILTLDDDTIVAATAIQRLASVFDDERVAIASGALSIGNKDVSIWTSLQSIEYLISITVGRYFLNIFGAVACCSGAFSMIRRSVYVAIGGNSTGPGEDLELTLRIRKLGYEARFVHDALATVDAPSTCATLVQQRLRWDRDSLHIRVNMFHELAFRKPRERLSDTLQRLDFIIFELIPTIIFPFYLVYILMIFGDTDTALSYLAWVYLVVLAMYVLILALAVVVTDHRLNMFDALVILSFPLYQGIFMKIVRFVAYSMEVLFSASRRDDYVPSRVRHALYRQQ